MVIHGLSTTKLYGSHYETGDDVGYFDLIWRDRQW